MLTLNSQVKGKDCGAWGPFVGIRAVSARLPSTKSSCCFTHQHGYNWVKSIILRSRDLERGMGEFLGYTGVLETLPTLTLPLSPLSRLQCPDPSPSLLNGHPQPRPVAFDFAWGGRETCGLTSSCSPRPPRQTSRGNRLLKSDPQGLLPSQAGPPPQVRAGAPAGARADLAGGRWWWQRPPVDR